MSAPEGASGGAPDSALESALGVVAGGGETPRRVAQAGLASGRAVSVVALEGFADAWVEEFPHVRAGIGEIGKMIAFFKGQGVRTVTFAGFVRRPNFASLKVDARGAAILPKAVAAAFRGDDALLRVVLGAFESDGLVVVAPESLDQGLLAQAGALGRLAPTADHMADIARGFEVARAIGALDIGQAAVVCGGLVLAVEAQEGTDRMLARIAELPDDLRGRPDSRRGVLVKAAKPVQDRRIDLPTIGVRTVAAADRAGLAGIAIETGGALIVDREEVARLADAAGLFVWAEPRRREPSAT